MIVPPKLLQAAQSYAKRGWRVLPVWWIQGRDCGCPPTSSTRDDAGVCSRPGKHPITAHGVDDATVDPDVITAWWTEHPRAHVGLATGARSDIVVLDIDPRNGGDDTLDALEKQYGRLPETVVAETGGGGQHQFYRYAPNLQAKLGPGVELQRDDQYIVAVPSGHLSGGRYSWRAECAPDEFWVSDLPAAWLKALERSDDDASATQPPPCDIPVEFREMRAIRYTTTIEGAISGEGGHGRTFAVAVAAVRGFILPVDSARRVLAEYNKRCRPQWSDREIEHKIDQAFKRARVEWGYLLNPRETGTAAAPGAAAEPLPVGEIPERIELTDTGNAMRFARLYRGQLVYCDDNKTWRWWDGQRWARDGASVALDKTRAIPREIAIESAKIIDDDKRKKTVTHALQSESARARNAMVTLAAVERGMTASHAAFDLDPWLLNVKNGTLDLRTATLREHSSLDRITQVAPIAYDPDARCPRFEQFVLEVFRGSTDLCSFMQRLVGYSITGDTSVHGLYVLWGEGSNGKSTLITTLLAMLGRDYAKSIQPDLLLSRGNRSSAQDEQVADLRGTRLAAMQETDRGQRLAEATVKMLTSNDEVVAVRKFEHPIRFIPTHKAWFATNHKPAVPGGGHGIWRRIHLIPFTQRFEGDQLDPGLPATLAGELPGVLAWAVRGCLEFQRRGGLEPPSEVLRATEEYRQEEDLVGRFIDDCLVLRDGAFTATGDLTKAFAEWGEERGERRMRTADLWEALGKLGCERARRGSAKMGTMCRVWDGVGLVSAPGQARDDDREDAYAGF